MSATLDAKRRAALAYLGERWILHPSHAPERRDSETACERIARELRERQSLAESIARPPPDGVEVEVLAADEPTVGMDAGR